MAGVEYVQYQVTLEWDEETRQYTALIPSLGVRDCGPDANTVFEQLRRTAKFRIEGLVGKGDALPCSDEGAGAFFRLSVPPDAQVAAGAGSPEPGGDYVQYRVTFEGDEEARQMCAIAEAVPIADQGKDAASALAWLCEAIAFHLEGLMEEGDALPESDEGDGLCIRTRLVVHAR